MRARAGSATGPAIPIAAPGLARRLARPLAPGLPLALAMSLAVSLALGLASCLSTPSREPGRAATPPRVAAAEPSPANGRPAPIKIDTEVTYIASLVHWIDSLAGTSGGKTIPTYRRLWTRRHGQPNEEETLALGKFAAARLSRRAQALCQTSPTDPPLQSDWRNRFLFLALEAPDLDGFLESVRPFLKPEEALGLGSALAHFQPGFDRFWKDGAYLLRFDASFQQFLVAGGIAGYLGEVARFFEVDPSAAPPPVLSFVLLPASGSTHAQAFGRRLLIEIRPGDTPADQVQVVAHETSHYLFSLIPEARLAALEARARAAGEDGERVWLLLHEALPTALGQGLAVARLTPEAFDEGSHWYHVDAIDRFAKRIYSIVRREIESGGTIDGAFLDEAILEYSRDPLTP